MAEEEAQFRSEGESGKRKLDEIQLAKQKAQEIVARLVSDAEAKRPRLDDSSEPPSSNNSFAHPSFSGIPQKPQGQLTTSSQVGTFPFTAQSYTGFQGTSKRVDIPNGKVGVLIGKGGETIKYLQLQSGARIQIAKDSEVDPYSQTRDVELSGTAEQISRAEQLIKDVLEESDAGASTPSATLQPGAEQVTVRVPNNKVALLIGKGGESIKSMQIRSGARIQIIPLRLPPGDTSTERNVYVSGTKEQIESAKELINEIVENRGQQGYRPPGNWAPPGPPAVQQPSYGYSQPGSYTAPPPPYYSNYPPQAPVWDQSNQSGVPPPQQNTGYDYYGQPTQTGSVPTNANYGYGQAPQTTNHNYVEGYSQQPQLDTTSHTSQNDQYNSYVAPGYAAPIAPPQVGGETPSQPYANQSSTPPPTYPVTYTQPGYNQTGFTHPGYNMQQPSQLQPPGQVPTSQPASQPVYGQSGNTQQPAPSQPNYVGTNSGYGYPQMQPTNQGYAQAYGAEKNGDESNAPPGYGSLPALEKPAHSQS